MNSKFVTIHWCQLEYYALCESCFFGVITWAKKMCSFISNPRDVKNYFFNSYTYINGIQNLYFK